MVELIGVLDGLPQRQVRRQHHVFSLQRDQQCALRGAWADARDGGNSAMNSSSDNLLNAI
jgi:hypothetical protein